jgi:hypothetical protein
MVIAGIKYGAVHKTVAIWRVGSVKFKKNCRWTYRKVVSSRLVYTIQFLTLLVKGHST